MSKANSALQRPLDVNFEGLICSSVKRLKKTQTITGNLVLNYPELALILFIGICARPQSQEKKVFSSVQVEFHGF